jgi:hypothetical protein
MPRGTKREAGEDEQTTGKQRLMLRYIRGRKSRPQIGVAVTITVRAEPKRAAKPEEVSHTTGTKCKERAPLPSLRAKWERGGAPHGLTCGLRVFMSHHGA